ncbi:MAG: DUF669 domain-containing protein [Gammaproteobacteria bacterium]|nr:DUF669 domain-containing protein [Gammaproteobacteria bacterium]
MAMIGHFDANSVAPAEDFSPIPVGDYPMQITDSDLLPTKKGGHRLSLTFEVTDGQFKGRKVWANLNLDNPNPKAVEIAQRELSAICHAVGKLQVSDSQELHYKPMLCRVDIETQEGYSPKNVIKAYKALAGGVGNAPAAAPNAPAATPASPSSPPWANKNAA